MQDAYPGSPITEIGANRLKRIVVVAKGRPNGVPRTIETKLLNCPGWWTRPLGTPGRLGRSCKTLLPPRRSRRPVNCNATTGPICAQEGVMAKKTARGRKQDRARVAGKQDYEVKYEAKKTGKSKAKVKRAVKKAGPSRKKVERALRQKLEAEMPKAAWKLQGLLPASHGPRAETLDGIRIGKSQDGLRFLRSKGKAPGHP